MTTLHIHLFGQLRLFWQERPYPFKALPKVEPLLVYLLLHQDAPVQRDSLAFKLWPDATEKQAKGRLRRHLYDLRRALPPAPNDQPWLLLTAQTAQWNPAAPYWLDERLTAVEKQLFPGDPVTQSQAMQVSQAVKAVAIALGKKIKKNESGAIYGELYRIFEITSYKLLPANKFEDAMTFLTEWHQRIVSNTEF